MIKVLVSGALGRMGSEICRAVDGADDMELVGGVDIMAGEDATCGKDAAKVYNKLEDAIADAQPEVMIDFTRPDAAEGNLRTALSRGVHCVLGTTGLSEEKLQTIYDEAAANGAHLFHAPNFTTGAVLMMLFAQQAGTAIRTARMIAANKGEASTAPGKETELEGFEGARGALVDGVPVHSVRTAGYVAHQEVIFGSMGQTLTIRHDSIDRASYMPGILMAVRAVGDLDGLVIGLENLMD